MDFTNPRHIRRLLTVYENILNTALQKSSGNYSKELIGQTVKRLITSLRNDGYKFENGKIGPIKPEVRIVFENAISDRTISEVTRRNIFDSIQVSRISWSGRLSETGFLSRLYDLESLPSFDYRHKTASGDIWQHREANPDDWSDDWLLTDSRFDLLRSSDEAFLQFLCETIHPIIRTEDQDVETLVKLYNKHLAPDGWEVVPKTYISGKPIFAARHRLVGGSPAIGTMKSIAASLDVNYITQQITRMEASVESDPELAIGTAKEFVETVCKTILREYGESISNNVDMPQLVKKVREKLDLLPDDIPEKAKGADTIKRVLSNLGAVAQGLAELRGLYGTGHGKDANVKGLHARHARLAVGAASALGVFLFETYKVRKGSM